MLFFRIFQHLLPRALPWRLVSGSQIRKFFEGLTGAPSDAREYVDKVWEDLLPDTTRELGEWEKQFGIIVESPLTETTRRQQVDASWKAQGGQSPHYIQTTLQAAGFDVYVHEWWSSGPDPYVARDPRNFTDQPLIGTVQCGEPLAQCGEVTAQANNFLANEPGYIVNLDLTPRAPPPVPDDPTKWPYFLYLGTEVFGSNVFIPSERRSEFERLLLKIAPTQQWLVTMVTFGGALLTEGGDTITTEGGDVLFADD